MLVKGKINLTHHHVVIISNLGSTLIRTWVRTSFVPWFELSLYLGSTESPTLVRDSFSTWFKWTWRGGKEGLYDPASFLGINHMV